MLSYSLFSSQKSVNRKCGLLLAMSDKRPLPMKVSGLSPHFVAEPASREMIILMTNIQLK